MTAISKLGLFVPTEVYHFHRRHSKKKLAVDELFCLKCGGLKPHCWCDSFETHIERACCK